MTHAPTLRSRQRMAGLSLIELLVSMAIGLILMIAIVSAYLGSATASKMAEAQGRMNEDAQAALSILTQHIRLAGNNPKQANYFSPVKNPVFATSTWQIRGCDSEFTNVAAADLNALACPTTPGSASDSVAIVYEADEFNTVKTSGGLPADCLGQALPTSTASVSKWDGNIPVGAAPAVVVPTDVTYRVADNRFYISSALGSPNLYCKGNGGANGQPLAENIEDMQITYGVAHPTTGVSVLGYLTASGLLSDAAFGAATPEARWSKVMSVRICVIARSEAPVVSDADSAKYRNCAGVLTDAPAGDLRLRRAYSTTVSIRNRVSPS